MFLRIRLRDKVREKAQTKASGSSLPTVDSCYGKTKSQCWRSKLKGDQNKYEEYLRKDADRAMLYRATLSDEKRKRSNEAARMRMQRYRERQREKAKEAKNDTPAFKKPQTRSELERKQVQKEIWRLKKQE